MRLTAAGDVGTRALAKVGCPAGAGPSGGAEGGQ